MTTLKINGQQQRFDGDPATPLLWYVRDELGLTGTKYGCGTGLCGSCTVHIDGDAARACVVTMGSVAGREVTTIEGLDPQGNHPTQKAWREHNVPQCGFCQAGQLMQASALLARNPNPTDAQIVEALAGNICRCGCYQRIQAAVNTAAVEIAANGG
ncbi:MAG: (2Fe-2S)-binding protein [Burkholderiaceae bacterium]